ncbi:hypothetical protein ACJX0J_040084, partial [Zea mays]
MEFSFEFTKNHRESRLFIDKYMLYITKAINLDFNLIQNEKFDISDGYNILLVILETVRIGMHKILRQDSLGVVWGHIANNIVVGSKEL